MALLLLCGWLNQADVVLLHKADLCTCHFTCPV
jgi:hypothetical protein